MTESHLEEAGRLLDELEQQVSGEAQVTFIKLKASLRQAWLEGEGNDLAILREQIRTQNEQMGEFISVMVHEIRKPMTSIRGYADMLAKNVVGELNPMQSQFANTIRTNIISMDGLVSDISDLTKMRNGRLQASPKMDMLKNVVMQLEQDMVPLAEERSVKLTFAIPDGLHMFNLDSQRLEQALRKLIDNAIKYTQAEQGEITVSAEGVPEGLKISVKDNGIGVSPEDQARLGELFFRGDHDLVIETKGYGMGIPIAMECMKQISGELKWESAPDAGSTFWITIPVIN